MIQPTNKLIYPVKSSKHVQYYFNNKWKMGSNCAGFASPQRTSYRHNKQKKPYLISTASPGKEMIKSKQSHFNPSPGKDVIKSHLNSSPGMEMIKSKQSHLNFSAKEPKIRQRAVSYVPSPQIKVNQCSSSPEGEGLWKSPLLSRTIKQYTKPLTLKEEELSKDPSTNTFFMNMMPVVSSSMGPRSSEQYPPRPHQSLNKKSRMDNNSRQENFMRVESLEDSIMRRKNMPPEAYNQNYQNQQLYDSPSEMKEIKEIFQTSENEGNTDQVLPTHRLSDSHLYIQTRNIVEVHNKKRGSPTKNTPSELFQTNLKEQIQQSNIKEQVVKNKPRNGKERPGNNQEINYFDCISPPVYNRYQQPKQQYNPNDNYQHDEELRDKRYNQGHKPHHQYEQKYYDNKYQEPYDNELNKYQSDNNEYNKPYDQELNKNKYQYDNEYNKPYDPYVKNQADRYDYVMEEYQENQSYSKQATASKAPKSGRRKLQPEEIQSILKRQLDVSSAQKQLKINLKNSIMPYSYLYKRQHGSTQVLEIANESMQLPEYVRTIQNTKGQDVRCDNFSIFGAVKEFDCPKIQFYLKEIGEID